MRYWLLGLVGGLFLGGGSAIATPLPDDATVSTVGYAIPGHHLQSVSDNLSDQKLKKAYREGIKGATESYCKNLDEGKSETVALALAIEAFVPAYRSYNPTASPAETGKMIEISRLPVIADIGATIRDNQDSYSCPGDLSWFFDR